MYLLNKHYIKKAQTVRNILAGNIVPQQYGKPVKKLDLVYVGPTDPAQPGPRNS